MSSSVVVVVISLWDFMKSTVPHVNFSQLCYMTGLDQLVLDDTIGTHSMFNDVI